MAQSDWCFEIGRLLKVCKIIEQSGGQFGGKALREGEGRERKDAEPDGGKERVGEGTERQANTAVARRRGQGGRERSRWEGRGTGEPTGNGEEGGVGEEDSEREGHGEWRGRRWGCRGLVQWELVGRAAAWKASIS